MRDYPKHRAELQQLALKLSKEIPGPMSGFSSLHKAALADESARPEVQRTDSAGNRHCRLL